MGVRLYVKSWARATCEEVLVNQNLAKAIGLSCTAFRDPEWVATYRPEWPSSLSKQLQQFAADVPQPNIPLPPKGAPPTRGELEF